MDSQKVKNPSWPPTQMNQVKNGPIFYDSKISQDLSELHQGNDPFGKNLINIGSIHELYFMRKFLFRFKNYQSCFRTCQKRIKWLA